MAISIFENKSKQPKDNELPDALGRANKLWDDLKVHLISNYEPLTEIWKFAGKNWGWTLQLIHKKRTVLYLTPCEKCFYAGFAFGEKAVKAAHSSNLPASTLKIIDSAQKFVEGRAIRLEIRNKKDAAVVKKLVSIKMSN